MKLRFNVAGFEIWCLDLDLQELHRQADTVETVVQAAEKRGAKIAGKVVDRFSNVWMRAWVNR